MKKTPSIYARALFLAISESHPKDHDKILDKFVKILSEQGMMGFYPQIEEEYERLVAESKGIRSADVTTARDVKMDKSLIEALNEIAGSKVQVRHHTDESLVGGVVIRVEDTMIDASVKGNLQQLKKDLSKDDK